MKIEINLKIILVLILFFIIQNVNTYVIFLIFIVIHEVSHLLIGICIGGKPRKLTISPFGASLEFYSYGKSKPYHKIMFFLAGPLINLVIALFFFYFSKNSYLNQIIIQIKRN